MMVKVLERQRPHPLPSERSHAKRDGEWVLPRPTIIVTPHPNPHPPERESVVHFVSMRAFKVEIHVGA